MAKRHEPQASLLDGSDLTMPADMVPDVQLPALPSRSTAVAPRVDYVGGTLDLIKTAIDKGIDPDALGKLLDLQDRVLARQAETEFNEALKGFQSNCPVIGKNQDGHNARYADFDKIVMVIRPLLDTYGLSFAFDSEIADSKVATICTIRHVAGHSKMTRFTTPIDSKPNGMNEPQRYAAVTTYGRRYSLILALGLVIAGDDRDGREAHPNPDERPDAPQVPSRSNRSEQVTSDEVAKLIGEWKTWQNGEPTREDFAKWAVGVTGGEWNPSKPAQWNRTRLNACWDAHNAAVGVPE